MYLIIILQYRFTPISQPCLHWYWTFQMSHLDLSLSELSPFVICNQCYRYPFPVLSLQWQNSGLCDGYRLSIIMSRIVLFITLEAYLQLRPPVSMVMISSYLVRLREGTSTAWCARIPQFDGWVPAASDHNIDFIAELHTADRSFMAPDVGLCQTFTAYQNKMMTFKTLFNIYSESTIILSLTPL